CSIYCEEETLLYENKLQALQEELGDTIFLVMRAFVEKSRTTHDWRGFVYQPPPLAREDIEEGIARTQRLFSACKMPLAMECIDPAIFPHLKPYLSWGFIGARTSTSTTHRILASSTQLPFGCKNSLDGDIASAVEACEVARHSHCILKEEGQRYTKGNPNTHVVLRGGKNGTNFDPKNTTLAKKLCLEKNIPSPILIDCSHGNCPNKPDNQIDAFHSALAQYLKDPTKIMGVMLESNLKRGAVKEKKVPHVSFTDPCLDFEETATMLRDAKRIIMSHKEELALSTYDGYTH
ncbi:3-deoxy-7-phosphoheptulonate synthase, partial [bacterium]|nr:3-deoxy-7-phosphoheptulonate synthase [bacterium]